MIEEKQLTHVRHLIKWHCEHETPSATIRALVETIDELRDELCRLRHTVSAADERKE
jgi:hypothetical protein